MAAAEPIELQGSLHRFRQSRRPRALLGDGAWASRRAERAAISGWLTMCSEHTLWVNKVPESRTVKQRVHLDVQCSDCVRADEARRTRHR